MAKSPPAPLAPGAVVVSQSWLIESSQAGQLLPADRFIVGGQLENAAGTHAAAAAPAWPPAPHSEARSPKRRRATPTPTYSPAVTAVLSPSAAIITPRTASTVADHPTSR